MSNNFSEIGEKLNALGVEAAQLDRVRGEHHVALFDQTLFHCQSRLLIPCVEEARGTFESINREQHNGRLTALRAEYLTERLLAQISAIARELSTNRLRKTEIKHSSHYRKPINSLYQELAQHQEWARRLRDLVSQKQQELNRAPAFNKSQAQKVLLATEQRLERCQAAIFKLENQITHREKNQ
jgi:primosomal replication protein N''